MRQQTVHHARAHLVTVARMLRLAVSLVSVLTLGAAAHAQDAPEAPASRAPLRLSRRCTCPDPSGFRTTPLYNASAIDNAGTVAGTTSPRTGKPVHAALGTADGALVDLFGSDLRSARAVDVNDAGVVVGEVSVIRASGEVVSTPFRFTPGRGLEALPAPNAGARSTVLAVNGPGDILVRQGSRGFVWLAATGAYVELPRRDYGVAVADLNDDGDVVGSAYDAAGSSHAALWHGRPHTLTILDPPPQADGATWSSHAASAINRRGTIVGTSCGEHGCLASAWRGVDHTFRTLGPGGSPTDVNDQDLAVGSPASPDIWGVLLAWDVRSGEEIRLPMRTPYMHIAIAVNDLGDAVGFRRNVEPDHFPAVRFPRVVCED